MGTIRQEMFPPRFRLVPLLVLIVVLGVLGLGYALAILASILIWVLIAGAVGYVVVQFWRRYAAR